MHWRYARRFLHSYGEWWLARDPARALAQADECLAVAERNGSRKNVAKGRRLRGQALLAQDRLSEAEPEIATAVAIAAEVGNPPQLWLAHVALVVIDDVAARLTDKERRAVFLGSVHVSGIRRAAEERT
jgi:hypothetical protein